jgi:hypothetical protein
VATVLVDAENVRRSRWPNASREELVRLCRDWAAGEGHRVVIVFDGRIPAVDAGPACELVGSGAESADDVLVREARERAGGGEIWLATSDRALREAAAPYVGTLVGGGSFLRALDEGSPARPKRGSS